MKKLIPILILLLAGLIILPSFTQAQDVLKSDKKIRIKIVKEFNGNRVVTDTIIEGNTDIIEKDIIDNSTNKNKFIVITTNDIDSEDKNYTNVDKSIIIVDDDISYDLIETPNALNKSFQLSSAYSQKVTDIELRDAGIKNKPDRLNAKNINLEVDGGIIDLAFTLKSEKTPKVIIYNVYGDKVFKGKPELINGNYQIKIDLSTKQHGTYYLQLIVGNASFAERIIL